MVKGDLLRSIDGNIYAIFIHHFSNHLIFVAIPGLGTWAYPEHLWIKV